MSARCPKPGCGALPCTDLDCPQDWTVKRLTTAGYRILAPGELDPETVERCASYIEQRAGSIPDRQEIATAIRSLGRPQP